MLFREPGGAVPLGSTERIFSSQLVAVEACRALDTERLVGNLDDSVTAIKRKELGELLAMLDLLPIDIGLIDRAKNPFAVNVRALDAIHVATAEVLVAEATGESLEFWTHTTVKQQRHSPGA